MSSKVIAICGTTASGKSDFALECMEKYGGIIINADSRQIYKGLEIISAIPHNKHKHFLYACNEPYNKIDVYKWIHLVQNIITKQEHKYYWIVGGTGFYIDALHNGVYENMPSKVIDNMLECTYENLLLVDAQYAKIISPYDKVRIEKAITFYNRTGYAISRLKRQKIIYNVHIVYLYKAVDVVEKAIIKRTESMFQTGAVEEVEAFIKQYGNITTIYNYNTIGLNEIIKLLNGQYTLSESKAALNLRTRRYAKKQRTWFNNHYADARYNLTEMHLNHIIEEMIP